MPRQVVLITISFERKPSSCNNNKEANHQQKKRLPIKVFLYCNCFCISATSLKTSLRILMMRIIVTGMKKGVKMIFDFYYVFHNHLPATVLNKIYIHTYFLLLFLQCRDQQKLNKLQQQQQYNNILHAHCTSFNIKIML